MEEKYHLKIENLTSTCRTVISTGQSFIFPGTRVRDVSHRRHLLISFLPDYFSLQDAISSSLPATVTKRGGLRDRSARASRAFMLMNGATRALLQAMHPYAKDAVRFWYDGLQIERKRRRRTEEEKKKKDRRREGKETGLIRLLVRLFARPSSSHVTKVWRKALYKRRSFSRLCLDMIPYRSVPGIGGKDEGGG